LLLQPPRAGWASPAPDRQHVGAEIFVNRLPPRSTTPSGLSAWTTRSTPHARTSAKEVRRSRVRRRPLDLIGDGVAAPASEATHAELWREDDLHRRLAVMEGSGATCRRPLRTWRSCPAQLAEDDAELARRHRAQHARRSGTPRSVALVPAGLPRADHGGVVRPVGRSDLPARSAAAKHTASWPSEERRQVVLTVSALADVSFSARLRLLLPPLGGNIAGWRPRSRKPREKGGHYGTEPDMADPAVRYDKDRVRSSTRPCATASSPPRNLADKQEKFSRSPPSLRGCGRHHRGRLPIASPGDFAALSHRPRGAGPVICGLARANAHDIDAACTAVKDPSSPASTPSSPRATSTSSNRSVDARER